MKSLRWLPLAALALLAFAHPATATPRFVWQDLKFRTTLTSSTSPTYASVFGGGANAGNRFGPDTTYYSTGVSADVAGRTDTTAAFSLPGLVPSPFWAPRDTTNGTAGTTGISTTLARSQFLQADTMYCFTVAIGPRASAEQSGETADSIYVFLDGSVDGQTWVPLTSTRPGVGIAEVGSGNSWFYSFFTAGKVRPAIGAAYNIFTWPLLRLRVENDNQNLGQFAGKVGYFREDLPGVSGSGSWGTTGD